MRWFTVVIFGAGVALTLSVLFVPVITTRNYKTVGEPPYDLYHCVVGDERQVGDKWVHRWCWCWRKRGTRPLWPVEPAGAVAREFERTSWPLVFLEQALILP